jgi:predicted ester cyclase
MLRLNRWFLPIGIVLLAVLVIAPTVLAQDEIDAGRTLVEQAIEQVWHNGNIDFVDEAFAYDFVLTEPEGVVSGANLPHPDAYSYRRYGPRGIYKAHIAAIRAAFPDLEVHGTLIGHDDYFVHQWVMNGTFTQPLSGMTPTGQHVAWYGMDTYRVKDGQIVEMRCIEDTAATQNALSAGGPARTGTDWLADVRQIDMTPELMRTLAERSIRVYNTGQRDDAIFTSDFALHLPMSSFPDPLDLEAFNAWAQGNHVLWPDCNVCSDTAAWQDVMRVDGDLLFYPFMTVRTHDTAAYMGLEPNQARVELPGAALLRFENGRIAEAWYLYDPAVMMAGLSA